MKTKRVTDPLGYERPAIYLIQLMAHSAQMLMPWNEDQATVHEMQGRSSRQGITLTDSKQNDLSTAEFSINDIWFGKLYLTKKSMWPARQRKLLGLLIYMTGYEFIDQ